MAKSINSQRARHVKAYGRQSKNVEDLRTDQKKIQAHNTKSQIFNDSYQSPKGRMTKKTRIRDQYESKPNTRTFDITNNANDELDVINGEYAFVRASGGETTHQRSKESAAPQKAFKKTKNKLVQPNEAKFFKHTTKNNK